MKITKIAAIYTLTYSIIGFILLQVVGRIPIIHLSMKLPFFISILHVIGIVFEGICLATNESQSGIKRLTFLSFVLYIGEIMLLFVFRSGINYQTVQLMVFIMKWCDPVIRVGLLAVSVVRLRRLRIVD